MFIEFNRAFRDRLEIKSVTKPVIDSDKKDNLRKDSIGSIAGQISNNNDLNTSAFSFADLSEELNKIDKN